MGRFILLHHASPALPYQTRLGGVGGGASSRTPGQEGAHRKSRGAWVLSETLPGAGVGLR